MVMDREAWHAAKKVGSVHPQGAYFLRLFSPEGMGLSRMGVKEKVKARVAQSCLTVWDPRDCSTPSLPVHYQLPELTQTHVH